MFHNYLHTASVKDENYLTIWIVSSKIENNLLEDDIKKYFYNKVIPEKVFIIYPENTEIKPNEAFISRLDYFIHTKRIYISYNETGQFSEQEKLLKELRVKAMTSLFNDNNTMMTFDASYHFQTLSGKHTDKFIKISNLLVNKNEIDFLSICLLEHINEKDLYVDTSTIISLIQATILLKKQIEVSYKLPSIYNFHSYIKEKDFLQNIVVNSKIIISTTTTATLVDTIRKHNRNIDDIVVLFYYPVKNRTRDFQSMLELSEETAKLKPPKNYPAEQCKLCKAGSIPVQLHGEQFMLSFKDPEAVKLTIDHQPKNMAVFFKKYIGKGILTFGGDPTRRSRFEFRINVDKLVENEDFNKKLEYVLKRHLSFSIRKIIYTDYTSKVFAEHINKQIEKLGQERLDCFSADDFFNIGKYDKDESILVLAGSISSGYVLEEISRQLRDTHPNSSRFYLIGINKLSSQDSFDFMKGNIDKSHMYGQVHSVVEIDKLLLPTKVSYTTWDKELELLNKRFKKNDFDPIENKYIRERVSSLEKLRKSAEMENIFWHSSKNRALELADGFAFWSFYKKENYKRNKVTQVDVLYSFACVLQYSRISEKDLKAKGRSSLYSTLYNQKVLAPENFARFNDGILQSSLLRLTLASELNYSTTPEYSKTISHMILNIVKKHSHKQGEAAMEFLIALSTKHLKLHSEDFKELIEELKKINGLPSYFSLLIEYLYQQLDPEIE